MDLANAITHHKHLLLAYNCHLTTENVTISLLFCMKDKSQTIIIDVMCFLAQFQSSLTGLRSDIKDWCCEITERSPMPETDRTIGSSQMPEETTLNQKQHLVTDRMHKRETV